MNAVWIGAPTPESAAQTCICGHPRADHQADAPMPCSGCDDCGEFRRAPRLRDLFARLFRRRPENQQGDDGLSVLLDAVMTEPFRPGCDCLACQLDWPEYEGEVKR